MTLCKLLQEICDGLRVLICLLLDFTVTNGIQLAKEPHLLQLADERLDIFGSSYLSHLAFASDYKEMTLSRYQA